MKAICLTVLTWALPLAALAQTTVFNDTFNSGNDSVNNFNTLPTANSTSFQWSQGAQPVGGLAYVGPGNLQLSLRSTTSEIGEAQALFTTAPVTLTGVGDWIDLRITLDDGANILTSIEGANASLNVGLFNSGGVAPLLGQQLGPNIATSGGATGWNGYGAKIFASGAPQIFQRPPQSGPTNLQDVLFDGQSNGGGFRNPTQSVVAQGSTATTTLLGNTFYTLDLQISLSAPGTLTISNALYGGTSPAPGNLIFSQIGSTNADLVTSFDALALGWRETTTVADGSVMYVTKIVVTTSVPEPSVIALCGPAFAGLAAACHFGIARKPRRWRSCFTRQTGSAGSGCAGNIQRSRAGRVAELFPH